GSVPVVAVENRFRLPDECRTQERANLPVFSIQFQYPAEFLDCLCRLAVAKKLAAFRNEFLDLPRACGPFFSLFQQFFKLRIVREFIQRRDSLLYRGRIVTRPEQYRYFLGDVGFLRFNSLVLNTLLDAAYFISEPYKQRVATSDGTPLFQRFEVTAGGF